MPAADQGRDRFGLRGAPFQLDRLAAGFFQDAAGIFDRLERPGVTVGKRHVDDHQRPLHGPADHFGMVDHFVERDRQGGRMPLHDHRQRVADQQTLDAGGVQQPGHGEVVGREHRDLFARGFHGRKFGNRHPLNFGHGNHSGLVGGE